MEMKKKKKHKKKRWLLYTSLVVVLLVVIVGGYVLYEFKFKTYDVADEEIDEIVEENYVINLPDGTEITVDAEGNIIEETTTVNSAIPVAGSGKGTETNASGAQNEQVDGASGTTGTTSTSTTTDSKSQSNSYKSASNTASPRAGQTTVASIKEQYQPTLDTLESQAASKINNLIARAKQEYATKKANGEEISVGYFYSKYMGAAEGLEANTDAAFNSVISIVESDLQENGFDKGHAQSLRDKYEAAKQARKDNLLSQVKGAL